MEKLLHWSIANAQGDSEAVARAGQPDPKLLEQLFGGGPDEPTLMKHAMAVISNPEATLENKLTAFDNFEMLIENLDNANNIENLKLWEPLIAVLDSPESELRAFALSVTGTAVQNNEKSQNNFAKYDGSLAKVMQIAGNAQEDAQVRIKAFYTLSSLIRHNKEIYKQFYELDGLKLIAPVLNDANANEKLKLRVMALLSTIMTVADVKDAKFLSLLRDDNIISSTLSFLQPESNLYLIDRVLNFLAQLIDIGFEFSASELEQLKAGVHNIKPVEDRLNEDDYKTVQYVFK
ncbi:hsp70 nucleotide exchange factor FES1 [Kluyveromyces marxianus]|uniref:Hsp70 nucleotide exchange factor FES1 n=2 Tax=Kluyveromyces marxianus TaxID=4911 RepID=W0T4K2_KLUMD|nr:hsp70 nucleotide exchange factor FES1 [Kluyveromyces marxianus DMKU3-1042]QGN14274.1 hsp70 nucleotide exchange factor FES1 [Kluyveromyces marxianus]BAO38537.1 hsp70 nucleotide exchange factor FES1 [Kluyveromyces marxianus DMKU3-1042]BAP70085.1 hsp70 nucleotide exchange factor FES1 [Kluyveromyces marxianus]